MPFPVSLFWKMKATSKMIRKFAELIRDVRFASHLLKRKLSFQKTLEVLTMLFDFFGQ